MRLEGGSRTHTHTHTLRNFHSKKVRVATTNRSVEVSSVSQTNLNNL